MAVTSQSLNLNSGSNEVKHSHEKLLLHNYGDNIYANQDNTIFTIDNYTHKIDQKKTLDDVVHLIENQTTTLNWIVGPNSCKDVITFEILKAIGKSKTLKNLKTNLFYFFGSEQDYFSNFGIQSLLSHNKSLELIDLEFSLLWHKCRLPWDNDFLSKSQKVFIMQLQSIAALPSLKIIKLSGISIEFMSEDALSVLINLIDLHQDLIELHLTGRIFHKNQSIKCKKIMEVIKRHPSIKVFHVTEETNCPGETVFVGNGHESYNNLATRRFYYNLDIDFLKDAKITALTLNGRSTVVIKKEKGIMEFDRLKQRHYINPYETTFLLNFINNNIDEMALSELTLCDFTLVLNNGKKSQQSPNLADLLRCATKLTLNRTLKRIGLNNFHCEQFPTLISMLTQSDSLRILDLSSNPIFSNKDSQGTLNALQKSKPTIQHLVLQDCELAAIESINQFEPFCQFIEKNNTIKILDIRYNSIELWPDTHFNRFLQALEKNSTLTELMVDSHVRFSNDQLYSINGGVKKEREKLEKILSERRKKIADIFASRRSKASTVLKSMHSSSEMNLISRADNARPKKEIDALENKSNVYPSIPAKISLAKKPDNANLYPVLSDDEDSEILQNNSLDNTNPIASDVPESLPLLSSFSIAQSTEIESTAPSAPSLATLLRDDNLFEDYLSELEGTVTMPTAAVVTENTYALQYRVEGSSSSGPLPLIISTIQNKSNKTVSITAVATSSAAALTSIPAVSTTLTVNAEKPEGAKQTNGSERNVGMCQDKIKTKGFVFA